MNLRRVVAFLLFLSVWASSVEVLIGDEAPLADAAAAQVIGDAATSPEAPGDADDCECLCACLCAGAQLVVVPTALPGPACLLVAEAPTEDVRGSATLTSPRPPHRPPLG